MRRDVSILAAVMMLSIVFSPFTDSLIPSGVSSDLAAMQPRSPVEWTELSEVSASTYLNSSHEMRVEFDQGSGKLTSDSEYFDPYFDHNSTIRDAIDASPQWLNDSLSWRFHDFHSHTAMRWANVLTDGSIDGRYMDEIAFIVAYLDPADLRSYYLVPELMIENVRMIYQVASEVSYADVIDSTTADGNHSTVVYRTPSGNVTLPEDIYYWYLAMPKNEMEPPAYINTTDFKKGNDPENGFFWRSYLYTANDTGYPVLRDLLLNETTLWNGTRNQITGNGAVGAVTLWESQVMEFRFEQTMRRDRQPVSIYKQHFGLCGENAQILAAAGKIALIPTIVTIDLDMMHAWNEFYERGWHQWEGYSHQIDNPPAEGGPGGIGAPMNLRMDGSVFTNAHLYTPTSNLTVRVLDRNGAPVDGAMVKIRSQPSTNHYGIYPLIGNGTDVNGEAGFRVGMGIGYFIQVLSPIGGWLSDTAQIPLAFPDTAPGQNYTFNVTLDTVMPLKANLTRLYDDPGFGIMFNVTGLSLSSRTRFYRDPWGYFDHVERDRPWAGRAVVLFLDDENLSLYEEGEEFFPSGILNITSLSTYSIILEDGKDYNIVVPGMAQPYSRSFISLKFEASRSVVTPEVKILQPLAGTYLVGEMINFTGIVDPLPPYIGEVTYSWNYVGSIVIISDESEFSSLVPWGDHVIEFRAYNESGELGHDSVEISIVHPNRPPVASLEGLANGSILEFGTEVHLTAEGSEDLDNDTLSFIWKDLENGQILSETSVVKRTFTEGNHTVKLNVTDGRGGFDTASVDFTILGPNLPPIPYIEQPSPWSIFDEGDVVHISANGTYDLEEDPLTYRWESSIDGNVSFEKEDDILFSPGYHQLTLFVSDGNLTANATRHFHVVPEIVEPNRSPVANINLPDSGNIHFTNDRIEFSAIGSYDPDGGNVTIMWIIDEVEVSRAINFSMTLSEGFHLISLLISDGTNTDIMNISIVVIDRHPILSIKVNGTEMNMTDNLVTVEGENMTFDASGSYDPEGATLLFEWSINGTVVGHDPDLILSFEPGHRTLRLRITDTTGKSSSHIIYLNIQKIEERGQEPDSDIVESDESDSISPLFFIAPVIMIMVSLIAILFIWARWRSLDQFEE